MEIKTKKKRLLERCKFYKGEEDCPKDDTSLGWEVEEMWVNSLLKDKTKPIDDAIASFRKLVPADPLYKDGTPEAVQALLFERYCHNCDIEPYVLGTTFSKFYAKYWKLGEFE